jgi:hypothetical protein
MGLFGEPLVYHGAHERISMFFGALTLLVTGPFIGMNVGTTVVWEAIDRGFKGGLVESNNELTGLLMGRLVPWFERMTKPFNEKLVKHKEDAFLVNFALYAGVGFPLLLWTFGKLHLQYGMSSTTHALLLCYVYHVIRLGPMFMNFAYVYAVCHKEGHAAAARNGLFAKPFDKRGPFRFVFNWWVGLFFGVLPSTFAIGHSINHHKYNNGPSDILSTCDRPRDEWRWLVAYIPRFILYGCNISTTWQFYKEGLYKTALNTILGTVYYLVFCGLVATLFGPWFSLMYLIYPFLEQVPHPNPNPNPNPHPNPNPNPKPNPNPHQAGRSCCTTGAVSSHFEQVAARSSLRSRRGQTARSTQSGLSSARCV